ncbi:MAG: hypothetical protein A2Z11_00175 [Candidatus Woykebacteria bacterium RBG_16_43_9]|uniref:Phosphoglycerate kinase n=1 Tax=Candidatus Woykebacteria bacterium RBG_16_43_9 TaxID=1802596 RepID=A0A1G1WGM6_9BACT|nr:MAG: hypothetical protein A2Z11_00175 [Candidatus Woykebacteria bacterium RBG_16_43_9]
MKSVAQAPIPGKRIIVRCDFDVPVENGKVVDASRIKNTLGTLRFLLDQEAKLVLISHIGRPKKPDKDFSLVLVKKILEDFLEREIAFQDKLTIDREAPINLVENLRFWPGEEENNQDFSKKLASLGDLYVNECFAASHRAHASIVGISKLLPAFAGFNLIKEIEELGKILQNPVRPLVAIIGGAKLETKLPVIYNLAKVADKVLVGGRLMFETDRRSLPENVVVAHDDVGTKDIGEGSIQIFREVIFPAKMIVWNGPMGVFEDPKYINGTRQLANSVIASGAYSVVGGGDTISALNKFGLIDKIDFVSTGGGAMLEFLAGKTLPGIEALNSSRL